MAPRRETWFSLDAWRAFHDRHAVVIWSFLASRLMLLAVGLLTLVNIRPLTNAGNPLSQSAHQALNIWGASDSGWYLDLATNGYQLVPAANGQANWAFFPAMPGLAAGLARLTSLTPFEAMLVVSNLSFLIALVLLHRLARQAFDAKTADVTVVLLCVAPASYIFSAAYTEALFLASLAGALLLIRDRRWLAAGLAAALAALTRNLGLALLLPYGWAVLERWRARDQVPLGRAEGLRILLGGLAPMAALAAFLLHLKSRTGDALAFLHIQKTWGRGLEQPFAALMQGLAHPSTIPDTELLSFAIACLALGLLIGLAFLRRWGWLLLSAALVLVPLATGVTSFSRYALVAAPLWILAGHLLSERPRAAMITIASLAMLNGFMMAAWTLALGITV
ncbi:mannosyltransferase family protein [Caulobacter sp. CCH9-E1]|uniref:mannosyltransferase family protein n=1 Tax=Caulobacter sp. CCH9-E1 TaxID=1768768 RepID=UPI00083057E1|nr:mannosyltransferase family protein [Caulobacter sp. CCH9-E1]